MGCAGCGRKYSAQARVRPAAVRSEAKVKAQKVQPAQKPVAPVPSFLIKPAQVKVVRPSFVNKKSEDKISDFLAQMSSEQIEAAKKRLGRSFADLVEAHQMRK